MTTQSFDQDNVFDEPKSAFDEAPVAESTSNEKEAAKKRGIPIWLWAVMVIAFLMITFLIVLVISAARSEDPPEEITPITSSSPKPVIAPQAPALVAPAPAPQPQRATPLEEVPVSTAPRLSIPGEDPAAAPAPQAENVPAPAEVATATPPAPPLANEERQKLNERIEALSSEVESLQQKLQQEQKRRNAAAPSSSSSSRRSSGTAKASTEKMAVPVPPAPITGITLKAIVDESAWLQTETGETVMVRPGDAIHGVGTVKSVDADAGTVRLSDGRVLR